MIACKHASSTSSITQSTDIERQFTILRATSKTTTATNLSHGFGLKGYLDDTFDNRKASGALTLKLPACKAIVDRIVSCSDIFGKAMSPKTTKRGFIENGMIDEQTHTYPDIVKMLQTCKADVKQEAKRIIFTHFYKMYTIMKTDGHIKEELYDRIGLDQDTNYAGDEIDKPDSITQEIRHRAKILSDTLQCQLRQRKE